MHILLLNWRDTKNEWGGGAEIYVEELAKRWIEMGHEVTFFCGQNYLQNLPEEEIVNGIKIIRKGNRYTLYLWAIWFYFTKFRKNIDVIIDSINGIPFFTPIYSHKPIIPLLFHVHDQQFFIELPFPMNVVGYVIEQYIFPRIYKGLSMISISSTTRWDLMRLGIPEDNVQIVYPGVDHVSKPQNLKKVKKFSRPTILYLGKIKKYKRVDLLIKLFPEILKKVPSARLLIAGWGSDGPYLADISMKSNIRKKVKILGPVSESEKKTLMSSAWVCAQPSLHEGWGIPVIEGNLYGTPSVAFRVPGLAESIRDGQTGLLADTEEDFVSSIVNILENIKLREKLERNSQKWAKRFTWDKAAKQFMGLIKKKTQ
jgi:glycosyltransferase involved in cell wall biosynthesis